MAFQDYTTYDEIDSANELTVITNRVTFTGLAIDETVSVGKDFGVDNFSDFVHKFKVHIDEFTTDGEGQKGNVNLYSLCKDEEYTTFGVASSGSGILIYAGSSSGGPTYYIILSDVQTETEDQYAAPTPPFDRWIEIEKSGATITAKIYSDAYSTLVDTLDVTGENTAYRYLGAVGGFRHHIADPDTATGYVENLDIDASAIEKVVSISYASISKIISIAKAGLSKIVGVPAN